MKLDKKNNEYWKWVKQQAKHNRKHPTWAEWNVIHYLKEKGIKFRFQKPFLFEERRAYIADFILKGRILIEIDGNTHLSDEEIRKDRVRESFFKRRRYKVFRIPNELTKKEHIEEAMKNILEVA